MIGADTCGDGKFEILRFGEALSGEVAGMEGSGDDDFSVNELLVECRILVLFV